MSRQLNIVANTTAVYRKGVTKLTSPIRIVAMLSTYAAGIASAAPPIKNQLDSDGTCQPVATVAMPPATVTASAVTNATKNEGV